VTSNEKPIDCQKPVQILAKAADNAYIIVGKLNT